MSEREIVERLRMRLVSLRDHETAHGCDLNVDQIDVDLATIDTFLRETARAGAVGNSGVEVPSIGDCIACGHPSSVWAYIHTLCGQKVVDANPAPEAVAAPGDTPALTKFDYLLNAMEAAGQADVPAAHGYGDKRLALYAHIRRLEADADRLAAAESRAAEVAERLAAVEREREEWRRHCDEAIDVRRQVEEECRSNLALRDRQLADASAALAQREGEVAQAYRWAAERLRRGAVCREGLLLIADAIDRGPTPPDGEG